jgi:hypothetical protein
MLHTQTSACQWHEGRGPVLIVAPHAGRCSISTVNGRTTKVNDLYTAELATALADQLDGSLILNTVIDRNVLDLNRISQVLRRAPWFVELLEHLVADILRRHESAEIVFVHGWNVVQPKCDVGIGGSFTSEAEVVGQPSLTASPDYVRQRLAALRARCAAEGIDLAYGERYPASHPNNLLQLFRRGGSRVQSRLTSWASSGRLQAVQLELGVPLRWPGTLRNRFVSSVTAAFKDANLLAPRISRTLLKNSATLASLQFYDPKERVGVMAGVAADARGTLHSRLLVFLEGGRVALFIGEDRGGGSKPSEGLAAHARPDGFALSFDGFVLINDDGRVYVHLEDAFATSRLAHASARLEWRKDAPSILGIVSGSMRVDGRTHRIAAHAWSDPTLMERTPGNHQRHVVLAASLGGQKSVIMRYGDSCPSSAVGWHDGLALRSRTAPPPEIEFEEDGSAPARFTARLADSLTLTGIPVHRMVITRSLGNSGCARVSFGVARYRLADESGYGFFEYAERQAAD